MSEIVERLRKHWSHGLPLNDIYPTCKEAADEIERLTRELAEAKSLLELENKEHEADLDEEWNDAIEAAAKVAGREEEDDDSMDRALRNTIAAAIRKLVKP